ncbi:MAG: hypothetical protein HND47_21200 [Chloroflexi bacterium]|nr:hypothetical protein [Chloroflexota bacterium]
MFYLIGDHLGSTSIVTDAAGNVVSQTKYREASRRDKAWGEVRYSSGSEVTKYQYTGQYSDSYINLLWYGSRHYDPALGRFTSADTITLLPPIDANHSNFFIALTVDFHEVDILKYLNAVNNKSALENAIESSDKDEKTNKKNEAKDDSYKKDTTDLRKALQWEDRSTSYTPDETVETMSALNKIGKIFPSSEQSKIKTFDNNKDLPFDYVASNMLDRYSYVKSCPTRYTDPSGHSSDPCAEFGLKSVELLHVLPIDLIVIAAVVAGLGSGPYGWAGAGIIFVVVGIPAFWYTKEVGMELNTLYKECKSKNKD